MPPVRAAGVGGGRGGVTGATAAVNGVASEQIRVSADIKQTLQTLLQAAALMLMEVKLLQHLGVTNPGFEPNQSMCHIALLYCN